VFTGIIKDSSKIVVGDDVSAYKFVAQKDLDIDKIAFENQRTFLKDWLQQD